MSAFELCKICKGIHIGKCPEKENQKNEHRRIQRQ